MSDPNDWDPNDWDNKTDMQSLIERLREKKMYDSPRLLEARKCLAAELALRRGDRKTFVAIHKGFAAGNSSVNGDYGGGGTHGPPQD